MFLVHIYAAVKENQIVKVSVIFFVGRNILIGDFVAIFSSAIMAYYNSRFCLIEVGKKISIGTYLGIMSLFVVVIAFFFSLYTGDTILIFSADKEVGLFGMFGDQ